MPSSSPVSPWLLLLLLAVEHVLPGLHRAGVQGGVPDHELLLPGGRDHVGVGVPVADGGAGLLLGVGAGAVNNVAHTPILALDTSLIIKRIRIM